MGQFLPNLQNKRSFFDHILDFSQQIWSERLEKVKQYHGMFKYICDSFLINTDEFKSIFGTTEKLHIWDPDNQNKVDALQLFSGLITFARQCSFKNKLNFIFNIFDFNEIKSLSFVDLQVMILCVCKSVYKIVDSNAKINQNEISMWLGKHLNKAQRVKITTLYHLCTTNEQVLKFLQIIHQSPQINASRVIDQQNVMIQQPYLVNNKQIKKYFERDQNFKNICFYQHQNIQWHQNLSDKIIVDHNQVFKGQQTPQYTSQISWVYGINTQEKEPPFRVIPNQNILYKTSSLGIIYNLQTNQQQILSNNQYNIKCIAYSYENQMIATADDNIFPKVHIWAKQKTQSLQAQENYRKIHSFQTSHSEGIKLLDFLTRDQYLVTVGCRKDSPIIIFNVETYQIKYKMVIGEPINRIFNAMIFLDEYQLQESADDSIFKTFFAESSKGLYQIQLFDHQSIKKQILSHSFNQENDIITFSAAVYINKSSPYLHSFKEPQSMINGQSLCLHVYLGFQSGKVKVYSMQAPQYFVEEEILFFSSPVTCLRVTTQLIIISTQLQMGIYKNQKYYQASQEISQLKRIRLNEICSQNLVSYSIKYLQIFNNQIIVLTNAGQLIRIQKLDIKCGVTDLIDKVHPSQFQVRATNISHMIKFHHSELSSAFCLLNIPQNFQENQDAIDNSLGTDNSEILLVATSRNKVIGINSTTHQIQDMWEIGADYVISHLQAVCADDGVVYVVCACKGGKLFIRIDWQQSPRFYDCKSQILDVKLSKDSSYLLAATEDKHLLFFTQINRNFISPRKIYFENQVPRSINFLDNFKFFTVNTSAHNLYIIQIPSLKHKSLSKQTDRLYISTMNLKYTPYSQSQEINMVNNYQQNKKLQEAYCSVVGSQMEFKIICSQNNSIYFFNSFDSLKNCHYSILNIHKCPITGLLVNSKQKKFYTLGLSDNTLIEWSVRENKYPLFSDKRFYKQYQNIMNNCQPLVKDNQRYLLKNGFEQIKSLTLNFNQSSILPQTLESSSINQQAKYYSFGETKSQKINKAYEKYWKYFINKDIIQSYKNKEISSFSYQNHIAAMKRAPPYSLVIQSIYGIQGRNTRSVQYSSNGKYIIYFCSHFIIQQPSVSLDPQTETIYKEETNSKITNVTCYNDKILYTVQPEPWTELNKKSMLNNNKKYSSLIHIYPYGCLNTTHASGIISIRVYKNFLFSYGMASSLSNIKDLQDPKHQSLFSMNLHNLETWELVYTSFTTHQIRDFLFFNEMQMLTLGALDNHPKIWERGNLINEIKIKATCAQIIKKTQINSSRLLTKQIKNQIAQKDVIMGIGSGSLVIMNRSGIFEVVRQAHEKAISHIIICEYKKCQCQAYVSEFITCGKDQKIKIWTQFFECKTMICLKEKMYQNVIYQPKGNSIKTQNFSKTFQTSNNFQIPQTYKIQSIAAYFSSENCKLVVALSFGKVYEIQLFSKKQSNHTKPSPNQQSQYDGTSSQIISQNKIFKRQSQISITQSNQSMSSQKNESYREEYFIYQIINSHTFFNNDNRFKFKSQFCRQQDIRGVVFSLHPSIPIMASTSCDNQLLIRNYETNKLIYRYVFEQRIPIFTKFSPLGNMLVIGFNNGQICFYEFILQKKNKGFYSQKGGNILKKNTPTSNYNDSSDNIELKLCQAINDDSEKLVSIINMEFSECGSYFAVSGIISPRIFIHKKNIDSFQKLQENYEDSLSQNKEQTKSIQQPLKAKVLIYHTRNTQIQSDIKYYSLYQKLQISQNLSNKRPLQRNMKIEASKKQVKQKKVANILKGATFLKFFEAQTAMTSNPNNDKRNRNIYLAFYEQFVHASEYVTKRIFQDKKIKTKIFSLNDHKYIGEQVFPTFLKWKFPHLINGRSTSIVNQHEKDAFDENQNQNSVQLGQSAEKISDNFQQFYDQVYFNKFYQRKNEVIVSDMLIHKDLVIYGDKNGMVHLVKLSSLLPKNQYNHFMTQNLQKSQKQLKNSWNLAKTYCSHTNSISQIQVTYDSKYIFVSSSQNNECIIQYQLINEKPSGIQIDQHIYPSSSQRDLSGNHLSKQDFYDFLNNLQPIRKQIPDILIDTEQQTSLYNGKLVQSHKYLKPLKFIGRSAFHTPRNLFLSNKNLIYPLGPNIIIQQVQNLLNQKYLPCSPLKYTSSPKISALTLTKNYAILSTQQEISHIYVWDIQILTCVGMCRAGDLSIIYKIVSPQNQDQYQKKISTSSSLQNIILVYGVNMHYEYSLLLLNWHQGNILSKLNLSFTAGWKIRDICSIKPVISMTKYNSTLQFVSCGVQHLCLYEFKGKRLIQNSFHCLSQEKKPKTIFTAVKQITNSLYIITSCENGKIQIYNLRNLEYVYQNKLHTCSIKEIYIKMSTSGIQLFTGGIQGTLMVSNISIPEDTSQDLDTGFQIIPTQVYNLGQFQSIMKYKPKDAESLLIQFQIQSVLLSLDQSQIFIGTRSGDIYSINRTDTNSIVENRQRISRHIIHSHDNNTIVHLCFDEQNDQIFYLLTASGIIEIWSITKLQIISFYEINQTAFKVFSYKEYVLIVNKKSIVSVRMQRQQISKQISICAQNQMKYEKQLSREFEGIINEAIFTKKDQHCYILVISLKKNQLNEIIIYQLRNNPISNLNQQSSFVLKEVHSVLNLKYDIQFMDFSVNKEYLLFKDNFQEIGMVSLIDYKRFNTIFVQMNIQWQSQGIRISPNGQKIYSMYSRENKITKIRRIKQGLNSQIIIGDQMGTLRIFDYPTNDQKIGQLHINCYTNHMNLINNIQVHPRLPYLLSSSIYDRSVILWKTSLPEKSVL